MKVWCLKMKDPAPPFYSFSAGDKIADYGTLCEFSALGQRMLYVAVVVSVLHKVVTDVAHADPDVTVSSVKLWKPCCTCLGSAALN